MCGRFASARKRTELLAEFEVEQDRTEDPLRPDYNVAPTKPIYAVLSRAPRDGDQPPGSRGAGPAGTARDGTARDGPGPDGPGPDGPGRDGPGRDGPGRDGPGGDGPGRDGPGRDGPGGDGPGRDGPGPDGPGPDVGERDGREGAAGGTGAPVRELRVVRWGLVPSWAKDVSIGSRMINARAETVATKPAFRRAFARHRCLIPADGYYEWMKAGNPGKPVKQPYYIHRADGGVLAFAGLYELWRDRDRPDEDPAAWLWSATIITTQAADEIGQIHDRMPMVIEPDRWADWLDPGHTGTDALHELLTPAASVHLASYPVSTEVNAVRHNGPHLIEPLADAAGAAGDGAALF
jgi:putative SOS response-associated peptidase YedK